jgi:predicted Mrr-cat superfamily restriction endonuclease
MTQDAFVLRIAPSGIDEVPQALAANQLLIGWSNAEGLLDDSLTWEAFRSIVRETYYRDEPTLRKAGSASGQMWRFIRDMKCGDLVVVPYGPNFYVAEVTGVAIYLPDKKLDDTAYRRPARWLNEKQPISRQLARSALLSRMKIQGTSASATDLLDEIKECVRLASNAEAPTFQSDLQSRMIREVLSELRTGRMESFGFERLIQSVMIGLGAVDCPIVPRSADKGADLIASFRVAGSFEQRVAIQAKHWQPEPPVDGSVVDQLIRGIEAEGADLGMVITSGSISNEASRRAEQYFDDKGIRIELIDGEQFAKLIVEHGIGTRS